MPEQDYPAESAKYDEDLARIEGEEELSQRFSGKPPVRRIKKNKTNYPWLALAVAVFFFDQLTKGWISNNLDIRDVIEIAPFLNITLQHNEGAAFSFLANAGGWQRWFFASVSSIVCLVLTIWLMRMPRGEHFIAVGLALILGGAAGNLWDRLDFGYVVDFIDVYYGSWHWPTFNVADSAITLGAIMLILHALFMHHENN